MPDFKITRYRIRVDEEQWGPDEPFTAVFLADLHNCSYGEGNSRLLQEIRNENPEVVFVAGDMITSSKEVQMDAAIALMNELTKKYPVFYVNGNHEDRLQEDTEKYKDAYEKYAEAIRSCGVHLLINASDQIEIHRMPITVWGLDLPRGHYRRLRTEKLTQERMEELLGRPIAPGYQLLLAHTPAYFDAYAAWGADLTLAGHLHGGMIRLPGLGGVVSPQLRLFPKYDKGLYTLGDKKMVVSAGLGSHSICLRVNNPPELVALDFRKSEKHL
ncbi:MAG: metallophosphoesterase [Lachnospiraceae bacterium]|nr:metallophosphoesterase [Lachnospiraceae bacterium]